MMVVVERSDESHSRRTIGVGSSETKYVGPHWQLASSQEENAKKRKVACPKLSKTEGTAGPSVVPVTRRGPISVHVALRVVNVWTRLRDVDIRTFIHHGADRGSWAGGGSYLSSQPGEMVH